MARVVVLFSGGKDSTYAAFCAMQMGHEVDLLTIIPEKYSMLFHFQNLHMCKIQAKLMGLKHVEARVKNGEDELGVLKCTLKKLKPAMLFTGGYSSEFQKHRFDLVCEELGIVSKSPLWHKTPKDIFEDLIENFEICIVGVAAGGLGKEHLGKWYDRTFATHLRKNKIDPLLEGGEAESFVANAPFFKKRILVRGFDTALDGSAGFANIIRFCEEP